MTPADLRIALFSGNYNYTRDGANQALNRLVGFLLQRRVAVRIYAPTVANPDFAPTGELVHLPSVRVPVKGRGEYRMPLGLWGSAKADLEAFAPDVVHVSSPDPAAHAAVRWARKRAVPVLASVHTRFETYPRYYNMEWLEPAIELGLRRFYNRCDALVAPSPSMVETLRSQGMNRHVSIWTRGVDREVFSPDRRCDQWREQLGIAKSEVVIAFLGRLVMEKGLDVFAATIAELNRRKVAHRVLVIGDGPARAWFEQAVPGAVFVGFQVGSDLGRALASADIFFNPSVTETFGNVTLEAMACALPVVAAGATGSASLVTDGVTGRLVPPGDAAAFAAALEPYCRRADLRRSHGAAGLAHAAEYSWDAVNQAVLDTYTSLVKSAPCTQPVK
ncbi:glycosyltransferase family 1 protein [Porphyrobacter sp. GA68]|uniref:glycosyltransferase family 4 protein n=1 Tax=Porphyrobacter sp. GA68 TaxID=2883480 RepID=UPI001D185268|nr:glycosyltransferase family 1 protein [Porphyrobacter sp. GA68]